MWDAIKSDLFDFVSTITEDNTKTINIVLGDTEDEDVRIIVWSRDVCHASCCDSPHTCVTRPRQLLPIVILYDLSATRGHATTEAHR